VAPGFVAGEQNELVLCPEWPPQHPYQVKENMNVFVVGPPQSGASAVARMVNLCGFNIGESVGLHSPSDQGAKKRKPPYPRAAAQLIVSVFPMLYCLRL